MKPRPRIRKTVKWGAAVVSVVLLALWVVSGVWSRHWLWRYYGVVSLEPGFVSIDWSGIRYQDQMPLMHEFFPAPFRRAAWFTFYDGPVGSWITIPIAGPAVVSTAISRLAWRLDALARRRARLSLCSKCNYNRTGLAKQACCPECGAPTSPL